jgi:hypothetical protein
MLMPFKKKEGVPLTVLPKYSQRGTPHAIRCTSHLTPHTSRFTFHRPHTARHTLHANGNLLHPYFHDTRVAAFVSVLFIPARKSEIEMPVEWYAN